MGVKKKIVPLVVTDPDPEILGPAMLALTAMQRRFVVAYTMSGHMGAAASARAAGYSDVEDGAKVRAFEVLRNPKVAEALREWTATAIAGRGAFIGQQALEEIAQDPEHPKRLEAARSLLAIAGFAEKTQHEVHVTDDRTDEDVRRSIRSRAIALGLDPSKLLGVVAPDVIDVEAIDVGAES